MMKPYAVLKTWLGKLRRRLNAIGGLRDVAPPPLPITVEQRAKELVRAIDAGGLPLNPAVVNHIARQLGLEVSVHAPVAHTVERIRKALESL